MAIDYVCSCGKPYVFEDSMAGRQSRCGRCRRVIDVPVFIASPAPQPPKDIIPRIISYEAIFAFVATLLMEGCEAVAPSGLAGPQRGNPILRVIMGTAFLWLGVLLPLTLPGLYSRRRVLSMGRWLILAVVAALTFFCGALFFGLAAQVATTGREPPIILMVASFYLTTMGVFGFVGCLVAAAVHPKDPPRP